MYDPVSSFAGAGVPPHGMGLTMKGRGHSLRHVGNSVISMHHEAHIKEGAATKQETFKSAGMIMVARVHCPWYVPERYTPQRSIPQGGDDHGMESWNVFLVRSLCYIVVATIWGVPPTTRNSCIYIYFIANIGYQWISPDLHR